MRRFFLLPFIGFFFTACSPQSGVQKVSVSQLVENCDRLLHKEVRFEGTYLGWSCPKNCPNPGVTRSDTCISDGNGCIYMVGTGGLDPLADRGKRVLVEGRVEKTKSGVCYIQPVRVRGF